MNELPCIVCEQQLEEAPLGGSVNQPWGATAFASRGHWGSTAFDGEPGYLEINVCTPCLATAGERGRVYHFDDAQYPVEGKGYRLWRLE